MSELDISNEQVQSYSEEDFSTNGSLVKINDVKYTFDRPVITGRDILKITRKRPHKDYIVFQFYKTGEFEEIDLDEEISLKSKGTEQFSTFKSDRIYRLKINEKIVKWGGQSISGKWLLKLSGHKVKNTQLFLIHDNGTETKIKPKDIVFLNESNVECFITRSNFFVCIEGQNFPWVRSTISTEEIIELGGWETDKGVVAIDKDQNERQLVPGEIVSLKGGLSFCKKQHFKRGLNEDSRIAEELTLLKQYYEDVLYFESNGVHWFQVKGLALPNNLSPKTIDVVFSVTVGYPATKPYGFYLPNGIENNGVALNFQRPPNAPPIEGDWCFKSWDAPQWNPKTDVLSGDNLRGWVHGFRQAILEGP